MKTPNLKSKHHFPAILHKLAIPAMLLAGPTMLASAQEAQPSAPSAGAVSAQPANHDRVEVPIIISAKATSPERIAAAELAEHLGGIYLGTRFVVAADLTNKRGRSIRLGTPASMPELLKQAGGRKLQGPESYVVARAIVGET